MKRGFRPLETFALYARAAPMRLLPLATRRVERGVAQSCATREQGRIDNLVGQRDPPPLPAPTEGAGALTPSILRNAAGPGRVEAWASGDIGKP